MPALHRYAHRLASLTRRWSRLGRPPAIPPLAFCLHRRPDALAPVAATATGVEANDRDLVARCIRAYQRAAQRQADLGGSTWATFFLDRHQGIHQCLMEGRHEEVAAILRNPASSELLYGFDNLVASLRRPIDDIYLTYYDYARWDPLPVLDDIVRLGEAIGAFPLENPERYGKHPSRKYTIEPTLAAVDVAFGFAPQFPNPYPGEFGLQSPRGIISQRAPHAIYQAWRISQLVAGIPNPRVLEIGAGLGRTAYYARAFGIADYTIVDIPITSLSQGYFLGRVLGEDTIHLFDETPSGGPGPRVKILPPASFLGADERYDLVMNADSLTELDPSVARDYWREIEVRSDAFLSINHEANTFTVKQLIDGRASGSVTRVPNWMRQGYVEETVRFRPKRQGGPTSTSQEA